MKNKATVFVAAFVLTFVFWVSISTTADKTGEQFVMNQPLTALSSENAIEHLKQKGQYESLDEAVTAARYEAELSNDIATSSNYANKMRCVFSHAGLRLESIAMEAQWQSSWRLHSLSYGDHTLKVDDGKVRTNGNRITINHQLKSDSSLIPHPSTLVKEWFNNTPGGLEHGFTLQERLSNNAGNLRLTIAVDGDLTAQADADGQTLRLVNKHGEAVLNYEKLRVWDADGVEITARMVTENGAVTLDVDDSAAKYPLVIDPTFSAAAKLVANDGETTDTFGISVAISGDTVIVGSYQSDIGSNFGQGAAYIFVRGSSGRWTQQAKLTATDGAANDRFGVSVAISGETVIVGAFQDTIGGNASQGSAYVFTRSGSTWTQQQKLTASDGAEFDVFGTRVTISGDTVVVGADQDNVGGIQDQGSAYVFVRSGTTWTLQQKLTAADGALGDFFGSSVAIAGGTVFTVIVGADGDNINGNNQQGSAYVFTRSGTTWTQQQKLTASDGAALESFGESVDITTGFLSFATAIVGAPEDDIGGVSDTGAAYVFTRSGSTWTQEQKLTASDGAEIDYFGCSVAISGGTVAIGACFDTVGSNLSQSGSTYVFTRSGGTTWTERQRLIAFDAAAGDRFGSSVDISANTVIVGAFFDNVGGNNDQGSAHIYRLGSRPFDFDDDGKADISVFRPSNGTWYLQRSTAGFTGILFGQSGDIPVAADYDGDGVTDTAVWRPSNGTWYLQQSTAGFAAAQFGQVGDIPVPFDAEGDGKADIRLFRPSNGTWYGLDISTGQSGAAQFGANGDLPLRGNFDGDIYADLAVFRPSNGTWYLLQSSLGFAGVQFGANGDSPVAGDFDGDGKSDIAVFRPSNGTWYRLDSSNNQFVAVAFGQNGDIPAPGDFDGDGKTDVAVFRPSNGYWYLLQSSAGFVAVQFGALGDIPAQARP